MHSVRFLRKPALRNPIPHGRGGDLLLRRKFSRTEPSSTHWRHPLAQLFDNVFQ